MRILASLLFFFLSFVLFTSCTILVLSYPRFTHSMAVKGLATSKKQISNSSTTTPFKQNLAKDVISSPSSEIKPQPTATSTPIKSGTSPSSKPPQLPTSTPKPTLAATATPKPSLTPSPVTSAVVVEPPVATGSFISQINAYRASNGLSPVSSNNETCSFASIRAKEIASDFSHNGFTNRINNKSLPYSSYHDVTENIAMNSDSSQIVAMWINSPGHAENMRKDTPFVCVVQNGNYFVYEGWRP